MKMSKKLTMVILLILELSLFGCSNLKHEDNSLNVYEKDYIDRIIENSTKHKNCQPIVSTEDLALKIGETLIRYKLGKDEIRDHRPFTAKYDKEYDVWYIKGTLKKSFIEKLLDTSKLGGVPCVLIRKSDGEIIQMWHSQ